MLVRGLVFLVTGGAPVGDDGMPQAFIAFGSERLLGVHYLVWVPAVLLVVLSFVMHSTPYGRRIYATGGNTEAARRDLVRICTEIREELEPEALALQTALELRGDDIDRAPHPARQIAGAIYVSCAGRGGPHFGAPSAELALVRHALGDVPLVGFFAGGEIAHRHLYGYTGVLTVFTAGASDTAGSR